MLATLNNANRREFIKYDVICTTDGYKYTNAHIIIFDALIKLNNNKTFLYHKTENIALLF